MNLNDKLKQERTGLTASQYSDLQELFVDRYVDGMSTKDLVEYVYNDMMQYVENQPEQEFLDDCKDQWDDAYDEIIQEIKEGDIDLTDNDDTFIDINNQFYYIGEEDDKVAPIDVKKFTEHCVAFIDSLEIEK